MVRANRDPDEHPFASQRACNDSHPLHPNTTSVGGAIETVQRAAIATGTADSGVTEAVGQASVWRLAADVEVPARRDLIRRCTRRWTAEERTIAIRAFIDGASWRDDTVIRNAEILGCCDSCHGRDEHERQETYGHDRVLLRSDGRRSFPYPKKARDTPRNDLEMENMRWALRLIALRCPSQAAECSYTPRRHFLQGAIMFIPSLWGHREGLEEAAAAGGSGHGARRGWRGRSLMRHAVSCAADVLRSLVFSSPPSTKALSEHVCLSGLGAPSWIRTSGLQLRRMMLSFLKSER